MNPALRLRVVRVIHTVIWAWFAGCIVAIPVAAASHRLRVALILIGIVSVEVAILVANRMRCPLTDVAGRYTPERRDNFDVVHDNQCLGTGLLSIARSGLPVVATVHHPITRDRVLDVAAAKWWRKPLVRRWYGFAETRGESRSATGAPRRRR